MATIHTPGFNSPVIQAVHSPVVNASPTPRAHFELHSPVAQSPVSFSLAGTVGLNKSTDVQNVVGLKAVDYTSNTLPDLQHTREIPTVYLPPIQYRYNPATGKLTQVGGHPVGDNTTPPPTIPGQFIPTLSAQYGQGVQSSFAPTSNVQFVQNTLPHYPSAYQTQVQYKPAPVQYVSTTQTQSGQPQPGLNFGHNDFYNISQIPTVYEPFRVGGYNATPSPLQFNQFPASHTQPVTGTLGGGFSETTDASKFVGSPVHGYKDFPGVSYASAVHEYNERAKSANGGFGNDRTTGSARLKNPGEFISKAFSNFENAAAKVFAVPDSFNASGLKDTAFSMLHPNSSNFSRAATFKLQRLENVPVNPLNTSKVAFGVVAYFDVRTENYNVHKSNLHWGVPSKISGLVNCNFLGENIKIPWNGEEFVFLKIVEQIGQATSVLGRLQLKLASLVSGHPLRVPIIGDDGHNKGNAILEFSMGTVSAAEQRKFNEEAHRVSSYMQEWEERSKCNRMPDYATALKEKQQFEEGKCDVPGEYPRERRAGANLRENELQIPKAIDHLIRWCCDITDRDLY